MTKTKLMRKIVDCQNGEIVEREFTAEEYTQWELDVQKGLALRAELEAKENAKNALFERLGISAEEASILLS